MAVPKIERLLNLLGMLLTARVPLPAADIRRKMEAYRDQGDEAFHRMFERDKTEIRELGYEIEAVETSIGGDIGYRIAATRVLLDDPGLAPDEVAALSLAAQAWGGAAGDGAIGAAKLAVGVTGADPGAAGWVLPRLSMDRALFALMDAIGRRKRVTFTYRTGGGGAPQERSVDPWGLRHRGAWYLSGYDHDRLAHRWFKLTRIEGAVSVARGSDPDFEPPEDLADVPRGPWEGEQTAEAVVAFAPDVGWWAERQTGAERTGEREDGWIEVRIPVADPEAFVSWVAGFGARAELLAPADLRAAIIAHLRTMAGA